MKNPKEIIDRAIEVLHNNPTKTNMELIADLNWVKASIVSAEYELKALTGEIENHRWNKDTSVSEEG